MKAKLLTKYETTLYSWDFSNWTFLEWVITVKDENEFNEIQKEFLETGKIELYENIAKYVVNTISDKKTTITFDLKDRSNHFFWDWFMVKENDWYKWYYWLELE